jgi:L-lactate utilization protein LutC
MTRITQYSAVNLYPEVVVDCDAWNRFPTPDIVAATAKSVEERGIRVIAAANGDKAMEAIKRLIPPGAEIMSGSSTTLIEIGFEDFAAGGASGWKPLHAVIDAENDPAKRSEIRRRSVTADYFISGANAIAQTGEIVACDASGSRVGAWPFAAGHLILVVGINKIVPTVADALNRVRKYAFPLENVRAKKVYGTPSVIGKCVILAHERNEGRITLILVKESLGY